VVSQRLVKRADGKGRTAAVEVMINSPNIRELIVEGKTSSIEKAIAQSGNIYGMQTFNQALAKLVLEGTVTHDDALSVSTNPNDLKLLLKGIGTASGVAVMQEAPKPIRKGF
jgi:Tfp pilus assembly ATPase PilU